ncbi:unnamed protein product [Peronospora destructor]|uniref:Reverse transcriptase domain-containing protein n=1 Tax=Peronospora destructor TaxID=86335 RepID=A0AAV0TGA5_9STRA|nr:unnamed protein product [Peronospora destructor]
MYPIKTAQSARVLAELLDELISAEVGKAETAATWDNTAKKCMACVQRIKKRETQRRNAVIHRIHAQNRARILTRSELLEVTVEEAREEHLVRLEQRLHRTTEQLRWTFKHKVAGADGLNNDFFKDTQAVMVPAMVAIGNELLAGGKPPKSFLQGWIIPLRKKGDSNDAMDYRPIALLQTGYKVYTKIIATRAQRVLVTPIGESQQGFVHGRQMRKTVMMMLALLATAKDELELAAARSRAILLLDFRKAYDTVAREFLFLVLVRFGFSQEFTEMIRKLHNGTTARFVVNGELSEPQEVVSGIRQGCPLAPLLFLVAAEVLALAIQQDIEIVGLKVPGGSGEEHKFSAFVDDSTVFMQEAQHLPRVMNIVDQFGRMSGLKVQPAKSKIIFLNTAVGMADLHGIPVLRHGDTVRYLGYAVGTGELTTANWAARVPVLFTAAVFEMPPWAEQQLRNLQKQFLWHHSTSTEASRHKVNPALLFTPKQAGGVGLASILIACKTQRVKHAILWLTQRKDIYFLAWQAWAFRGATQDWTEGVSPRQQSGWQLSKERRTPGNTLQQLIGPLLLPTLPDPEGRQQQYTTELDSLASEAISWTTTEEWVVELSRPLRHLPRAMTPEEEAFWPAYSWAENPWIVDLQGNVLTSRQYAKLRPCTITELRLRRIGIRTYSFIISTVGATSYQQAKLRRWVLAILLSAPSLAVGQELQVRQDILLRHPPKLTRDYT